MKLATELTNYISVGVVDRDVSLALASLSTPSVARRIAKRGIMAAVKVARSTLESYINKRFAVDPSVVRGYLTILRRVGNRVSGSTVPEVSLRISGNPIPMNKFKVEDRHPRGLGVTIERSHTLMLRHAFINKKRNTPYVRTRAIDKETAPFVTKPKTGVPRKRYQGMELPINALWVDPMDLSPEFESAAWFEKVKNAARDEIFKSIEKAFNRGKI